jgi:hypothetical protein
MQLLHRPMVAESGVTVVGETQQATSLRNGIELRPAVHAPFDTKVTSRGLLTVLAHSDDEVHTLRRTNEKR